MASTMNNTMMPAMVPDIACMVERRVLAHSNDAMMTAVADGRGGGLRQHRDRENAYEELFEPHSPLPLRSSRRTQFANADVLREKFLSQRSFGALDGPCDDGDGLASPQHRFGSAQLGILPSAPFLWIRLHCQSSLLTHCLVAAGAAMEGWGQPRPRYPDGQQRNHRNCWGACARKALIARTSC